MTTSIETTCDLLDTVLADLANVVGGIDEDQLGGPTPCDDFDVAQLRHHILGWLTIFAAGFADPDGRAADSIDGYQVSDDPAAEVRSAAAKLSDALRAGAAERPLWLGAIRCRATSRST